MTDGVLSAGGVGLDVLEDLYRGRGGVAVDPGVRAVVDTSSTIVAEAASGDEPVYGVNTGFGKLASIRISPDDTTALQRNLILSHCCGTGDPIDPETVRLMMILKVLSFCRGCSGVRWAVVESLLALLASDVTPVIPSQGSVGASGDLAPLAHMSAVLIGEGEAIQGDRRVTGKEALAAAGIQPLVLGPKEGLALINGTQFSTAVALAGLFDAWRIVRTSIVTAALATDAAMGSTSPLDSDIHRLRGHQGQIDVAVAMRALMAGSDIRESHRSGDARVQDPYCLRCQPQVAGAAIDLMRFVARTLTLEANAVTDNPIVLTKTGRIISGGNFHGEPVAFAADLLAMAVSEIGSISQRRVALLIDPAFSFGLPPFLATDPGLNSGFMAAEIATAALMSENRHLANPCSTDTTPTSAGQEDHVSMSAHGALRLGRMNENLAGIIATEALCAAQGVETRAPLLTSPPLRRALRCIRKDVSALSGDRYLMPDIEMARRLVRSGELESACGVDDLPRLTMESYRSAR
ncbi:MAG: histidine ammonia-lyase [Paracoccaceae bacterium]|nr:histidine ammonia-lyase [Paracoccaceae bacterium]